MYKTIREIWQYHWNSIPSTSKLKNHEEMSHLSPNLYRKQNMAIIRIRIGQNFLTYSYLISNENQPVRDIYLKALTVKDIQMKFTKYNATRMGLNIEEALIEEHRMKIINFLTIISLINKPYFCFEKRIQHSNWHNI